MMMRRVLGTWALAWLLAHQALVQAQADDSPEPFIELRALAQAPAEAAKPVDARTKLRAGDLLRLEVAALRSVYLYVIHLAPNGHATLLYSSSVKPIAAGDTLHLPEAGEDAYELDNEPGDERIIVLASPRPVQATSPQYAALIRSVTENHRLPAGLSSSTTSAPRSQATHISSPTTSPSRAQRSSAERTTGRLPGTHDLEGLMRGLHKHSRGTIVAFASPSGVAIADLRIRHVQ